MATIKLAKAWTYRTPAVTIDYGVGEHEVADVVRKAALAAGVIEEGKANGNGSAKDRPARATDTA